MRDHPAPSRWAEIPEAKAPPSASIGQFPEDPHAGGVFAHDAEIGWQPKTDERIIPISPALQQILFEQFAKRRSKQWVFANQKGQPDIHILEKLKKVCRRAGIRAATVHGLRHSFGAHLRMAGVSLADIADLLGHKDLATTQIYAKVQQKHLRTVVGKLTGLVPLAENDDLSHKPVTQVEIERADAPKLLTRGNLADHPEGVAERVGFEPTVRFPVHTLSKRAQSTTLTSLRLESMICGRHGSDYRKTLL